MSSVAINLLQRAYSRKKKDFPGFSLRWMSSKLGVSHVYLSHMLNGRRPLAINIVEPMCEILDLDSEAKTKLLGHALKTKGYKPVGSSRSGTLEDAAWTLAEAKNLDLLGRWETIAILQATSLNAYDGSAAFIAKSLRLPEFFVKSVLELLTKRGFVTIKNGKLTTTEAFYEFQSRSSKKYIKAFHRSIMANAVAAMEHASDDDLAARLITSATFTCAQEDVARLKQKIADFLKEFVQESAKAEPDSVYQFGLQFIPLIRPT